MRFKQPKKLSARRGADTTIHGTPEQQRMLADAMANPKKYGVTGCSLCDQPFLAVGLFVPTESFAKRIGQPKGKQRLIVYGLCEGCFGLPDKADRVEAALLKQMTVQ
jgi:hypothetical protein